MFFIRFTAAALLAAFYIAYLAKTFGQAYVDYRAKTMRYWGNRP